MILLSSNRQNTVNNYSNTSTHRIHTYNSLQKTPNMKRPYLSWTLASPGPNKTSETTLYRKPAHTDQYLHWDSNHFFTAKNGVFNALAYRKMVVCSNQHTLQQETDHIWKALLACNFPQWAFNSLLTNSTTGTTLTTHQQPLQTNTTPTAINPITKIFPQWYHTQKDFRKSSKRPATVWVSKCTSMTPKQSEPFSWPPRIKTKMPKMWDNIPVQVPTQ